MRVWRRREPQLHPGPLADGTACDDGSSAQSRGLPAGTMLRRDATRLLVARQSRATAGSVTHGRPLSVSDPGPRARRVSDGLFCTSGDACHQAGAQECSPTARWPATAATWASATRRPAPATSCPGQWHLLPGRPGTVRSPITVSVERALAARCATAPTSATTGPATRPPAPAPGPRSPLAPVATTAPVHDRGNVPGWPVYRRPAKTCPGVTARAAT